MALLLNNLIAAIIADDVATMEKMLRLKPANLNLKFIHLHYAQWDRLPGWRGAQHGYADDRAMDMWKREQTERRRRWPDFVWRLGMVHLAALLSRQEVLRYLIRRGADIESGAVGVPTAHYAQTLEVQQYITQAIEWRAQRPKPPPKKSYIDPYSAAKCYKVFEPTKSRKDPDQCDVVPGPGHYDPVPELPRPASKLGTFGQAPRCNSPRDDTQPAVTEQPSEISMTLSPYASSTLTPRRSRQSPRAAVIGQAERGAPLYFPGLMGAPTVWQVAQLSKSYSSPNLLDSRDSDNDAEQPPRPLQGIVFSKAPTGRGANDVSPLLHGRDLSSPGPAAYSPVRLPPASRGAVAFSSAKRFPRPTTSHDLPAAVDAEKRVMERLEAAAARRSAFHSPRDCPTSPPSRVALVPGVLTSSGGVVFQSSRALLNTPEPGAYDVLPPSRSSGQAGHAPAGRPQSPARETTATPGPGHYTLPSSPSGPHVSFGSADGPQLPPPWSRNTATNSKRNLHTGIYDSSDGLLMPQMQRQLPLELPDHIQK